MDAPEHAPDEEELETNVVTQLFGIDDPWMRFDLWANRAWESVERAVAISIENGPSLSESTIDDRVAALFHSASLAKEFAEMVNPLAAAANAGPTKTVSSDRQASAIMSMLFDDED